MKEQQVSQSGTEPEILGAVQGYSHVYTIDEVAGFLRCSYHTVWRLCQRGKIKQCTYMPGRIPASEVERLLTEVK